MRYCTLFLALFFHLLLTLPFQVQAALSHGFMRPDAATIVGWQQRARRLPKTFIDPKIRAKERQIKSASVLAGLSTVPEERNQEQCGNCWVWAGQAAAGVELSRLTGVRDRLSVQFLNSCDLDRNACCGGMLDQFAGWYRQKGLFVPWNNNGAAFSDGQRTCSVPTSPQQCSLIDTSPHYSLYGITAENVYDTGDSQATIIAKMKNVIDQGRAIWFGFFLPDQASWDAFQIFWNNRDETAVYSLDAACGQAWNDREGGGHAVLIVGYDDTDANNRSWLVLNSWGTAGGRRPQGLFRIPMDMDYSCSYSSPYGPISAYIAQTLNIQFSGGNCSYALTPPAGSFAANGGSGSFTVNATSGCSWSASASAAWITLTGGGSGQGTAVVRFQVDPNPGAQRSGTIQVGDKQFTIIQLANAATSAILKNPGFEQGDNGDWTLIPGNIIWAYPCYQQVGSISCAREGENLAWFGGYDNAHDSAYQDVTLDGDASQVVLRFWYAVESNDLVNAPYDFLTVSVTRLRDGLSKDLFVLDNTMTTTDWQRSPDFDLTAYRGETIRIQFVGTTDASLLTNFFIDDVTLAVTGSGGIPGPRPGPAPAGRTVLPPLELLLLDNP